MAEPPCCQLPCLRTPLFERSIAARGLPMAGVFLSYDRDDRAAAKTIANALERAGHSVWWDLHVRGGAQFSKVIEEALKAADAVVVLWSKNSIESNWVRDEAAAGRDSGRLVPTTIDGTEPPLGFRQYQTIRLTDWKRGAKGRGLQELQQALSAVGEGPSKATMQLPTKRSSLSPWLAGVPLAALVAVGAYFLWPASSAAVPTVSVVAASSGAMSQALSRDLLAKLGVLQRSNGSALQLIDEGGRRTPDLIFKVDASDSNASKASLLLLSGRERDLLWSGDFDQPSHNASDLKQQLAYSAASVLECAAEAYGPAGRSLDNQTRKLYLSGCGAYAEDSASDLDNLIGVFREVTRRAPKFQAAWGQLLTAEDDLLFSPPFDRLTPQARAQFSKDVAAARKVNPDMAEAYVGQSDLMSADPDADPLGPLNRAVASNPNSVTALTARSSLLMQIGRVKDGVADARRALQTQPFSPRVQDAYISALMYAGEIDAARDALSKADALFPGASSVADARYRLNLRYGSAQEALEQRRKEGLQSLPNQEVFLKARIDPSPTNVAASVNASRKRMEDAPAAGAADYVQTLAQFGKQEDLIHFLLGWKQIDDAGFLGVLFRPTFHDFWRDPRSMQVAAHFQMFKYWRRTGLWPDFCSWPDLPYDCKKEAAKLGA